MNIITIINDFVDPFIMQIVIVPLISIGIGVWISVKKMKFIISPIITFLISLMYSKFFLDLPLDSLLAFEWEIRFSILSLIISIIIIKLKNTTKI
ncbi:MAG: hypothetical protein RRZ84_07350 [Romboutsia sp.]